eukprot:gene15316-20641_t
MYLDSNNHKQLFGNNLRSRSNNLKNVSLITHQTRSGNPSPSSVHIQYLSLILVVVAVVIFFYGFICASIVSMDKLNTPSQTLQALRNIAQVAMTAWEDIEGHEIISNNSTKRIFRYAFDFEHDRYVFPSFEMIHDNVKNITEQIAHKYRCDDSLVAAAMNQVGICGERSASDIYEQVTWRWYRQLHFKIICTLQYHRGSFYFYHTRKAAGTFFKQILNVTAKSNNIQYFESEGKVLNEGFLSRPGFLTITTLRHPIDRIVSLYWYEHVTWFAVTKKTAEKCLTIKEWSQAWLDSGSWKKSMMRNNSDSVYIEIENYYVKMLSNWSGNKGIVTERDYQIAIRNLERFDLIFLKEFINQTIQIQAIELMFPIAKKLKFEKILQSDKRLKLQFKNLTMNQEYVIRLLVQHNTYDLRLWEYAQSLVEYRLQFIQPIMKDISIQIHNRSKLLRKECSEVSQPINHDMKQSLGIFRPFGHKGPF